MTISAGGLRHWLTFERKVSERDSDGALVESWADAFAVSSRMPCEVVPLSGRELIDAQSKQSVVTARIRVRYRDGLVAKMRARATDGTIYNIEAVIPDPDSGISFRTLLVSTGLNDGS